MTIDELLDHILIPRPNGSRALDQVGDFIADVLAQTGAAVSWHEFLATPYGFQLTWAVALALVCGYGAAILFRRYGLAIGLMSTTAALLLVEFELLWSPISGLWSETGRNVVGTFPGEPGGPVLVLSAHYDTTTHFGDHFSWGRWGFLQGPATALAFGLALTGAGLARRGRELPRPIAMACIVLVALPFSAMFWFQSVGPLVRSSSPGALDNGGSVVALLELAQQLERREKAGATTVRLLFLAAEEERTLGSWAYARELGETEALVVVNLESIGASEKIAYVAEDGFALTRYRTPVPLISLVNQTAEGLWGDPLDARELPLGTLTDARSFLAHGIPAITLRAFIDDAFPRRLHSRHDSRDRLVIAGIERTTELLLELISVVDRGPSMLRSIRMAASTERG